MNLNGAYIQRILFFFAPVASGFLLFLAFPPYDFGWLAWIGLIPLFIALTDKKPLTGFLCGYICGLVFFLGVFNWTLQASGYTYLHHMLLDVYLGFFFGLFGLLYALISKRFGTVPALIAAPFLWVSLEYVRSNLSFLALPWGLLAHSQYQYLPIIQAASLAGVYGVSFWVVSINSVLTLVALYLLTKLKFPRVPQRIEPLDRRIWLISIIGGMLLICTSALYGLRVAATEFDGQPIRVSVVQGNVTQAQKFDRSYARKIMDLYAGLSALATDEKPDLIVWPETATPRAINQDRALLLWIQSLADSAGVPLLLGSAQVQKYQRPASRASASTNSAFMILPGGNGNLGRRYDKMRLFPFGEYLPYRDILPWSAINVPDVDHFSPGKEFTLFDLHDVQFAVTICWENMFPDIVRQFVKCGARFVVNITNEAWFGKTAAPYQFLSMNVFRAVENGVYVVRCANTGISCLIDPHGRVADRVRDDKGNDVFVSGTLTGSIVPVTSNTVYTLYGDWLVWGCIAFSGIILFISLVNKTRKIRKF